MNPPEGTSDISTTSAALQTDATITDPKNLYGIGVLRLQTTTRRGKWRDRLVIALAVALFLVFLTALAWSQLPVWGRIVAVAIALVPASLALTFRPEAFRPLGLHLQGLRLNGGRIEIGSWKSDLSAQAGNKAGVPGPLPPGRWTPDPKQCSGPTRLRLRLTNWDPIAGESIGEWRIEHVAVQSTTPAVLHYFEFVSDDRPLGIVVGGDLVAYPSVMPYQASGRLLAGQLGAINRLIEAAILPQKLTIEIQVKAPRGNTAMAAAFGLVGLAVSAVSDLRRFDELKRSLGEGSLINSEVDRELFALTERTGARLSLV